MMKRNHRETFLPKRVPKGALFAMAFSASMSYGSTYASMSNENFPKTENLKNLIGLQSSKLFQKTRKLTGKVIGPDKKPVAGVSVWIKETTLGTTTQADGTFTLDIPADLPSILLVRYVGFKDQEIVVEGNTNNLNIELTENESALDEVQVVGFGTQRKESVIGAISTIKPSNLKIPNSSISTNLAGQLGGIVSIQRSGKPGSSAEFWIRGISTFGANKTPLILVDGVERSLDLLDPEEIESFSLLKDATATALYGVRGANGVVIIKTKRGKEGKPQIAIKTEMGVLQPTKVPEMANSVEYATLYNEAKGFEYYTPEVIQKYRDGSDPDLYPNVNWLDEVFKSYTKNQRVTANVTGGGDIARYFVSTAYYHEDGIFESGKDSYNGNPTFKRYNFRSNVDINLHPKTVLALTLGGYLAQRRSSAKESNIWEKAFTLTPNAFPIRYSNGYWGGSKDASNPYYEVMRAGYTNNWQSTLNAMMSLDQNLSSITEGLKANVKFAFDTDAWHNNKYTQQDDIWMAAGRDENGNLIFNSPEVRKGGPWFENSSGGSNATYLEGSINYDHLFGKHRVGGLILYNHRVKSNTASSAINSLPYKNQGLAGRVTYDYDTRYFIEGNFGYNGSENFASGHRLGFFPSVAVGWYISNEKFFEPLKSVVSKLKVRSSIGQVGNDQIGGDVRFIYLGTVTNTSDYIYGNYTKTSGERSNEIPNPNVGWEVSTKKNLGFELGLFNKIEIQGDWYHDVRDHIFVRNNNIPAYAGLQTVPMVNIGKMKSWGFDSSIEYNDKVGEVYLTGRGTFTYASNQILRNGDAINKYPYLNTVGRKLFQYFGYQSLGLFNSQEEIDRSPTQFSESLHSGLRPGDIKYQDINGDGVINDFDKIPIGMTDIPEITYGFGGSIGWKGIDFSIFFQGTASVTAQEEGYSLNAFTNPYAYQNNFNRDVVENHWSENNPNPDARYPRLSFIDYANNNNTKRSSFWTRDASFIRLRNIEVGYTLPKTWSKRVHLQNLRIYASGVNLLTWAPDMRLFDPELGTTDGQKYPPSRIFNIGLNIGL
ncbi:TonB-dependent receptor [Sphingobacterium sp. ML3W]|uniref:SusC/RagA family TonB-linked outer membrane protein n=1 Tax=Sphingobacterium sp. ML3W TaxID=1538644 RepID=UPI00249C8EF6|nr:TonB-dependent receptor [Sphingobacterium sp. ML3W]WFA81351.1 TonB-dependent receptor [Sphingobacterium sp. ML3W]